MFWLLEEVQLAVVSHWMQSLEVVNMSSTPLAMLYEVVPYLTFISIFWHYPCYMYRPKNCIG